MVYVVTGRGGDSWQDLCSASAEQVIECAAGKRPVAPAISGELLEGGTYDSASSAGKVVVVNFWGSWCPPCRAEIDDLEAVYESTKAKGVDFLGINIRDSRDAALAFHNQRVAYPSVFDPSSKLALGYEIPPNSIPATIVVDRSGDIAYVIRRAVTTDQLQRIVERVAAEAS
ncbi:TlpA disulfide reductase family protein [Asanoa sp. WMMD1127]|uniref:TlpA family protein disulfide reductase n=1 Tax=Asanoa sp. WMMD1127 TaxID=3016107 RepID=UPI00241602D4|nr:TlpA disulfide reductase family protein [Asanoa sp. WMMD1127]MDG4821664.1 TlpA disulfide reductase family protein [Asanoa sp. WMMD1127]